MKFFSKSYRYQKITNQVESLYSDINPFQLSIEGKKIIKSVPYSDLTYGEFTIPLLLELIDFIDPKGQQVFYDLGCGSGKTLISIALYRQDLILRGIEIVQPLAKLAASKWTQLLINRPKLTTVDLTFSQGNLLEQDLKDANIVLINATAFSEASWQQVVQKFHTLPTGCHIIITSKSLPAKHFQSRFEGTLEMSWGFTTTRIYEKISANIQTP